YPEPYAHHTITARARQSCLLCYRRVMRTLWACYNDTDDEAYESYYDRRYEAQRSPSSLYGGLPETKIDLINASVDSFVLCLNLFASRFEAVCNAPNDVLYPLYSP